MDRKRFKIKKAWQRPTFPRLNAAVSSALRGLTTVFGMGTGVAPSVWLPGNILNQKNAKQDLWSSQWDD